MASMNYSLLPISYQKEIRREKIMRIGLLFVLLISTVFFVGIIFMLPSYFTLVFSRADVLRRLDAEQKALARQDTAALEQSIGAVNGHANAYKDNEAMRKRLGPIMVHLAAADTTSIRLSYIDFHSSNGGMFTITLNGVAITRDALLAYIQNLKEVPEFAAVHSPISNLLKEIDVPFSLEVDIKKDSYYYVPKP